MRARRLAVASGAKSPEEARRRGARELQQLVEEVRAMSTIRLVTRLAHFLCHKLMRGAGPSGEIGVGGGGGGGGGGAGAPPPGPARDAAWESEMFVRIYEGYSDLVERLRRKRSFTLFHLPVMVLCIRAAVETMFKDAYPNYTRSRPGAQLLQDLDAAVSAMFDPDSWHSKISFLEGEMASLRILRDPTLRASKAVGGSAQAQKIYGTSPLIRSLYAGDLGSAFAKRQVTTARRQAARRASQIVMTRPTRPGRPLD